MSQILYHTCDFKGAQAPALGNAFPWTLSVHSVQKAVHICVISNLDQSYWYIKQSTLKPFSILPFLRKQVVSTQWDVLKAINFHLISRLFNHGQLNVSAA